MKWRVLFASGFVSCHSHHRAGSAGSQCIACHMPKIEQTIADVDVRAHAFPFIAPRTTERLKVPNPCTSCHNDKTNAWRQTR